jgi:hypothetical protein
VESAWGWAPLDGEYRARAWAARWENWVAQWCLEYWAHQSALMFSLPHGPRGLFGPTCNQVAQLQGRSRVTGPGEGDGPGAGYSFIFFIFYFISISIYFEPFQIQIFILGSNLNFKLIKKHTQNPNSKFMFKCNHPKYRYKC